jgi:hypothetical protein
MMMEKLKETLKGINRAIYSKMNEHLVSLSGQSPLEALKYPTEAIIKQ